MKHTLATTSAVVAALVVSAVAVQTVGSPAGAAPKPSPTPTPAPTWRIEDYRPRADDNAILYWNEQVLGTIRADPKNTGPTVTARALGIVQTATYDAWAAYDPVAKGTRLGSQLRRPAAERTEANKTKAISYAAWRTLSWLFPGRKATYDAALGAQVPSFDPAATWSPTGTTPVDIGVRAAEAVIAYRSNDNSNQAGNYADTTGYQPVNTWNMLNDKWRWQPLCVPLSSATATTCGGTVQKALTPQWGNVTPFSLAPSQYQVYGPPKNADGTYQTGDIDSLVQQTAFLTESQKAQAEYWADGPGSVFPPGHDFVFAQAVSRQRGYTLDADAKLFFALGNAMMDASIAAWYQKYKWDFVRPITAIRERYRGQTIQGWKGPGLGFGAIQGENWIPYQATNVVTPGFPEYVSGHSTFSGAGMAILSWFTGGDTFGATVTVPAGSLKIEPGLPTTDVTFALPRWSQTGEDAGTSRRLGGIHFASGDVNGRALGRQVATYVYSKANQYINGQTAG
jgi:hypothetical protein